MNRHLAKYIIEYALKRKQIESILDNNFKYGSQYKTLRGDLQRTVAAVLNQSVNNKLIKEINAVLSEKQVRQVRIQGGRYYRGVG